MNIERRTVFLWKMTRREFREGIEEGRIKGAIIPIGSTEQHNEHLEMIHDTASALHIAEKVALQFYPSVVVTTPLAIGVSEHWMAHKGTLTTRPEIFTELLYDVCDSLMRGGVHKILVVNGHAGNIGPVQEKLESLKERLENVDLRFCSYWEAYSQELIVQQMESGDCPGHASEFETSFALAAFPERVHWEGVDYDKVKLTISKPEQVEDDRNKHHEAKLATAKKGEIMIEVAVEWVTGILREMVFAGMCH